MKLEVLNQLGEKTGETVTLPAAVFDCEERPLVVQRAVRLIRNNARQGTASTKERWAVAGSTRKLFKQKGTGRARAGSAKSPLRRHGGTIFGPRAGRDYGFHMNKKERRLARIAAFSARAKENKVSVIDQVALGAPSTKALASILSALGLQKQRVLMVTAAIDRHLVLSARNLPKTEVTTVDFVNTYDLLLAHHIVFMRDALHLIEKNLDK